MPLEVLTMDDSGALVEDPRRPLDKLRVQQGLEILRLWAIAFLIGADGNSDQLPYPHTDLRALYHFVMLTPLSSSLIPLKNESFQLLNDSVELEDEEWRRKIVFEVVELLLKRMNALEDGAQGLSASELIALIDGLSDSDLQNCPYDFSTIFKHFKSVLTAEELSQSVNYRPENQ